MKKLLALLVMSFMVAFASPSFASVGVVTDGTNAGQATDIDFRGNNKAITVTDSRLVFNLMLAGAGNGGGTSMATSDTNPDVSFAYHDKAIEPTDPAFQTGTLPDGKEGQFLTINITERTGSGTYTLSFTTSTQLENVLFDAVGERATFWWTDDTNGWSIFSADGATVTLEDGL